MAPVYRQEVNKAKKTIKKMNANKSKLLQVLFHFQILNVRTKDSILTLAIARSTFGVWMAHQNLVLLPTNSPVLQVNSPQLSEQRFQKVPTKYFYVQVCISTRLPLPAITHRTFCVIKRCPRRPPKLQLPQLLRQPRKYRHQLPDVPWVDLRARAELPSPQNR